MWRWVKQLAFTARPVVSADAPAAERQTGEISGRSGKVSSKYMPLHKYLVNRYADCVVLTFAQLEDLTGGPLPHSARAREEWWTRPDGATSAPPCAEAWILAGRTAQPNLLAGTVTFERPSPSHGELAERSR